MRLVYGSALAMAIATLVPIAPAAQAPAAPAAQAPAAPAAQDANRSVAGGGITVQGWMGKIDAGAEKAGQSIKDAKLSAEGKDLKVVTGPAVTYWNPANKAAGNYTVKATFTEPKYMNINDHPHPYGIVIGGNDLGTPQETYLYCAAYGNGTFIVRGFGPEPFRVNGGRGEANDAVCRVANVARSASLPRPRHLLVPRRQPAMGSG